MGDGGDEDEEDLRDKGAAVERLEEAGPAVVRCWWLPVAIVDVVVIAEVVSGSTGSVMNSLTGLRSLPEARTAPPGNGEGERPANGTS